MKICIITLGCKVNQYESAALAAELTAAGHEIVSSQGAATSADRYIVNTCAVTGFAEKKSRYQVNRIRRLHPNAQIEVRGCAAQHNPAQFAAPNTKVFTARTSFAHSDVDLNPLSGKGVPSLARAGYAKRKIAYIKVQDGCNNFCSYCIVPHLRGRSKSRPLPDILAEIQSLQNSQITLIGIDLSAYGLDLAPKTDLAALCLAVDKLGKKFSLSSLEVRVITPAFLTALKDCKNFIPHFHLSLQSGCDSVLTAMNRHYKAADYANRTAQIRAAFPDAILTTDVIVGFPTETDADFAETLAFVKSQNFQKVHIFPYSPRPGTPAAALKPLQDSVVTARAKQLEKMSL